MVKRKLEYETSFEKFNKINEEITSFLITKLNINKEQITKNRYNVELINAIRNSDTLLVRILLNSGAEPNYNKAILIASYNNSVDICQLLLEYGADPYTIDSTGDTYKDVLEDLCIHENTENIKKITGLMGGLDIDLDHCYKKYRSDMFS